MCLEVTEAIPLHPCVEVDLDRHDCSPFVCLGQRAAVMIINCREHPVSRDIFVRAADDIDMVLASPC